jgi:hypothetical protein
MSTASAQIKEEGVATTAARRSWEQFRQGAESLITLARALPLPFPALAPAPTTRLHQSAATLLQTVIRRTITTVSSMPPNDSVCAYMTAGEKKPTRRSEGVEGTWGGRKVDEGEKTGKEGRAKMLRMVWKRGEEVGRGGEAWGEEVHKLPLLATAQCTVRSFLFHMPHYADEISSVSSLICFFVQRMPTLVERAVAYPC